MTGRRAQKVGKPRQQTASPLLRCLGERLGVPCRVHRFGSAQAIVCAEATGSCFRYDSHASGSPCSWKHHQKNPIARLRKSSHEFTPQEPAAPRRRVLLHRLRDQQSFAIPREALHSHQSQRTARVSSPGQRTRRGNRHLHRTRGARHARGLFPGDSKRHRSPVRHLRRLRRCRGPHRQSQRRCEKRFQAPKLPLPRCLHALLRGIQSRLRSARGTSARLSCLPRLRPPVILEGKGVLHRQQDWNTSHDPALNRSARRSWKTGPPTSRHRVLVCPAANAGPDPTL